MDVFHLASKVASQVCRERRCLWLYDEMYDAAVFAARECATYRFVYWRTVDAWRKWTKNSHHRRYNPNPLSLEYGENPLTEQLGVEDRYFEDEAAEVVARMLERANPKERAFIEAFLAAPEATRDELGAQFGITGWAISQRLLKLRPLARSAS